MVTTTPLRGRSRGHRRRTSCGPPRPPPDARGRDAGGIFAVFTPSPAERWTPLARSDGVLEFRARDEVGHSTAAAYAAEAAGRLLKLARDGHVRLARTVEDLDQTYADSGPRPPCCTSRALRQSTPRSKPSSCVLGRASLPRPGLSRPNTFAHGSRSSRPRRRHGAGADPSWTCARAPLRRARDPGRFEPPHEGRLLGRRRATSALVASHSRCMLYVDVAQPDDRQLDAIGPRAVSSESCSPARSCAGTSPTTPTRRST